MYIDTYILFFHGKVFMKIISYIFFTGDVFILYKIVIDSTVELLIARKSRKIASPLVQKQN